MDEEINGRVEVAMDRRASQAAPAVAVKPLDWARGWMNAEAASILGPYKITYRRDGSFEWIIGEHNVWAPSWDAAMAAAQADYEQRIRSALVEPAPQLSGNPGELPAPAVDDVIQRALAQGEINGLTGRPDVNDVERLLELMSSTDLSKPSIARTSGWALAKQYLAALVEPAPAVAVPEGHITIPKAFLDFVRDAPVSSGVCCCGDNMATHAEPMFCGHTPRDQWEYSLSQWLDEIAAAPEPPATRSEGEQ